MLHVKYFEKLMSRLLHSTIHQVMWYSWVFVLNRFSLSWSIFLLRKTVFSLVSLSLAYRESIILYTSGKPNVGFFLKITSPAWIILSISLDELNSINWLLKSWRWILFYCCKRILIWQNILEVFWRTYLNIIFWILLWMLIYLVIWNLKVFASTTMKYCFK